MFTQHQHDSLRIENDTIRLENENLGAKRNLFSSCQDYILNFDD